MLLELGSGERPFYDGREWTHSDERAELADIELRVDAGSLQRDEHGWDWIEDESCEEIRAAHLLEHFPYWDTVRILKDWRKALKHDGLVHIEVPNIEWQAKALLDVPADPPGSSFTKDEIIVLIYGEQNYEGNYHKTGFTPESLSRKLDEAGFIGIEVMDIGQVLVAEARRP